MQSTDREMRRHYLVRKTSLRGQETDHQDLLQTTAGERLGMMWQLALDAWAFTGQPLAESRLSRPIIRVLRSER
jgi:hypothetical protein